MNILGENLRRIRGNESQSAFAARFGMKQAIYSHYENGRNTPSLDVFVTICQALGVSADELLGLAPSAHPSIRAEVGGNGNIVIGNNNTIGASAQRKRGRPRKSQ